MTKNISYDIIQCTASIEMCQEVLEKRRNILGDDDPATLRVLSNIAFIYMQTEEYYEACLIYKRISEKQEELLKKETANHAEEKLKREDIEKLMERLKKETANNSQEKQEQLHNENIIPDEQKESELENHNEPPLFPMPPPPPLVPPPPLLPPPPVFVPLKYDARRKDRPKPSKRLKSFNLLKLPDAKLQGTIWSEIEEWKWYKNMELESLDNSFFAYEKSNVNGDSIVDQRKNKKESLVIDFQRVMIGSILLKSLKISEKELFILLETMDVKEQIPIDMVEELLKFTPSAKEEALLDERSNDINSLHPVERFLYAITKIRNYEQRLKSIQYQRHFMKTVEDLEHRIKKVKDASNEVTQSRRLKRILGSVLFLGNYMKPEASPDASGYRLASLNRLSDMKSSSLKGTTLLHHLVQVFEKEDKELLQLEIDIPHVREASKESLDEMDKDITMLKAGLEDISRGIDSYQSAEAADSVLDVMTKFRGTASLQLTKLVGQFEVHQRYNQAIRFFGEDGSIEQPAEFFGILNAFLSALEKAGRELQEREEKRVKQETELKKRPIERKIEDSSTQVKIDYLTVDLVSVFGYDKKIKPMRRARSFIAKGESRERAVLRSFDDV